MRSPKVTEAMLPPPAPIDATSIDGTRMSAPASAMSDRRIGLPATITPTSKLVPPISVVSTFGVLRRSDRTSEPITPAAGPENSE